MTVTTIGIDLAKSVFQVHGVDSRGHAVLRKQLRRIQLQQFFANLPPCLIGMESYCRITLLCSVAGGNGPHH